MTTEEALQRGIEEVAAELLAQGGRIGVAVRAVRQGWALDLNASERFPSASVIKIAILVELMAQVAEGRLSLNSTVALRDEAKVPGSGVLTMLSPGGSYSLLDLAHLMMNVSDNTASNMLIDQVGCDAVNERLAGLGLRLTRLERKFYDFEARDRGRDNWATAGELADLLVGIERRTVVSASACETMLAVMRKQQFTSRIPALLPPETPVANKTGSLSSACHDIGIIYSPAGPLVVAVLTADFPQTTAVPMAEGVIRHVARLTYECWGTVG